MKLVLDFASGRETIQLDEGLTITAQVIVSGDRIIAEPALHMGHLTWRSCETGELIGAMTVEP